MTPLGVKFAQLSELLQKSYSYSFIFNIAASQGNRTNEQPAGSTPITNASGGVPKCDFINCTVALSILIVDAVPSYSSHVQFPSPPERQCIFIDSDSEED